MDISINAHLNNPHILEHESIINHTFVTTKPFSPNIQTNLERPGCTSTLVNALEYLAVHANAQALRQDRVIVGDRVFLWH